MVFAPAKQLSEAAKYWLPAVIAAARSSLPEPKNSVSPEPVEGCLSVAELASTSAVLTDISEQNSVIEVIRKRPDFLAANRGKRFVTPAFVLLAHKRRAEHPIAPGTIRYGITVTKKIGNAVARNRLKRRFRALLAELLPQYGIIGVDHIMIGRKQDDERDFAAMKADLEKALKHLAKKL